MRGALGSASLDALLVAGALSSETLEGMEAGPGYIRGGQRPFAPAANFDTIAYNAVTLRETVENQNELDNYLAIAADNPLAPVYLTLVAPGGAGSAFEITRNTNITGRVTLIIEDNDVVINQGVTVNLQQSSLEEGIGAHIDIRNGGSLYVDGTLTAHANALISVDRQAEHSGSEFSIRDGGRLNLNEYTGNTPTSPAFSRAARVYRPDRNNNVDAQVYGNIELISGGTIDNYRFVNGLVVVYAGGTLMRNASPVIGGIGRGANLEMGSNAILIVNMSNNPIDARDVRGPEQMEPGYALMSGTATAYNRPVGENANPFSIGRQLRFFIARETTLNVAAVQSPNLGFGATIAVHDNASIWLEEGASFVTLDTAARIVLGNNATINNGRGPASLFNVQNHEGRIVNVPGVAIQPENRVWRGNVSMPDIEDDVDTLEVNPTVVNLSDGNLVATSQVIGTQTGQIELTYDLPSWLTVSLAGTTITATANRFEVPLAGIEDFTTTVTVTRGSLTADLTINASDLTRNIEPHIAQIEVIGQLIVGEHSTATAAVVFHNWDSDDTIHFNDIILGVPEEVTVSGALTFADPSGYGLYRGEGIITFTAEEGNTLSIPSFTATIAVTIGGESLSASIVVPVAYEREGYAPVVQSGQIRGVGVDTQGPHNIGSPLVATNNPTSWNVQGQPWVGINNNGQLYVPAGQTTPGEGLFTIEVQAANNYGTSPWTNVTIDVNGRVELAVRISENYTIVGPNIHERIVSFDGINDFEGYIWVVVTSEAGTAVAVALSPNIPIFNGMTIQHGAGASRIMVLLIENPGAPNVLVPGGEPVIAIDEIIIN
jgi:hypothetical protein